MLEREIHKRRTNTDFVHLAEAEAGQGDSIQGMPQDMDTGSNEALESLRQFRI